jgi:hypothetical protein
MGTSCASARTHARLPHPERGARGAAQHPRWHDKWFLADHHQDLRAALRVVWLQGELHSARLDAGDLFQRQV